MQQKTEPVAQRSATPPGDAVFKAELTSLIPHLRAFGYSLAGRTHGEDLAQEAAMKAWTSRANYQPGTSMKAWTFTILRNAFLSDKRRSWRSQPLSPVVAETMLVANDDPASAEDLLDVRNAMQLLPLDQREALILVGAAGLSYDQAADICGCAVGTIKSRVSRARAALNEILETRAGGHRMKSDLTASTVLEDILAEAAVLHGGRLQACA